MFFLELRVCVCGLNIMLSTLEESTKFQHVADDRVDNSRVYDIYDGHNGMGIIII